MTLGEALNKRVPRIRNPIWYSEQAYLRLPLLSGGFHGPWAELYDEPIQRNVMKITLGSQHVLLIGALDEDGYEPYTGPVSQYEQDNYAKTWLEE